MSGGSWDYISHRIDDIVGRLGASEDPLRRLMSKRVAALSVALHAIEWVDSDDWGKGEDVESIRAFLEWDLGAAIKEEIRETGEQACKDIHILMGLVNEGGKG